MESDDIVSGEFQRSTRMPLDAVVRLHFQGTVAYQNGFAANVSASGMFVKHPAPPPLGTQLVFEFNLGVERKPVQGAGEVVWVRERYIGPGQPAGVGIRFLQLDSQSRDHIAEALFEYLEESLAEDSLLDSSAFSYVTDPPAAEASEEPVEAPGDADPFEAHSPVAPSVATEPFNFAPLEKLPRQIEPAATQERKRAFSVFSPLDDADPHTADIVREALREETPRPSMAAAAASTRQGSPWKMVLLILLLAGAGGYFAWTQWGSRLRATGSETDPAVSETAPLSPAAARKPTPLDAAPAPGTTLAEQVGVTPSAISPATTPALSGTATAPPEEPSDVAAAAAETADVPAEAMKRSPPETGGGNLEAAPPRPPAPATPAASTVPSADPSADPSAARAAAPSPAVPSPARAQRLVGINWNEAENAPGQTSLVLLGDGAFAAGTFSYSEIGGENPRLLIKLKGMDSPYRGPTPRGGGALVRGVRTGFHLTSNGNEIHVVVDLAQRGLKVVSLLPEGFSLTLRLAP